jgi:hypothetical protein
MELYCACGERINTSGGNINSVEQWSYIGQTRVLIYAVCSHGKVVVDNRSTTVELPKCDHCGSPCGTDCDGSSHYTPSVAKDDVRSIAPDEFPEPGME